MSESRWLEGVIVLQWGISQDGGLSSSQSLDSILKTSSSPD